MKNTREKVIDIIVDKLGVKREDVVETASLTNDLCIDSLDILGLIVALETKFNIQFPDDRLDDISTVGDVINLIENTVENDDSDIYFDTVLNFIESPTNDNNMSEIKENDVKTFYVEVDINDADYMGNLVTVSNEDFEKFKPLIKKINEFEPYQNKNRLCYCNFPYGIYNNGYRKDPCELYDIDEDTLDEFVCTFKINCGEDGFHTITRIQEIVTMGEEYVKMN